MKGMTLRKIVELTQGDFCLSLPGEDGSCLVLDQDLALRSGEKARSAYEACLDTEISSIVTDSRKAGKGSLFGAIAGTRVDGHAFIPSVFAQGAVCALMERKPSEDELAGIDSQRPPALPDFELRHGEFAVHYTEGGVVFEFAVCSPFHTDQLRGKHREAGITLNYRGGLICLGMEYFLSFGRNGRQGH